MFRIEVEIYGVLLIMVYIEGLRLFGNFVAYIKILVNVL